MRGRLINAFLAEIFRVDSAATAVVAGGGYDPEFQVVRRTRDGSQLGASSRVELPGVMVPAQIMVKAWGGNQPRPTGHEDDFDLSLTLHRMDLERLDLIDPTTGQPMLTMGDRIGGIYRLDGVLVELFPDPPGMFVVETERAGVGMAAFGTPELNLLYLHCQLIDKSEIR